MIGIVLFILFVLGLYWLVRSDEKKAARKVGEIEPSIIQKFHSLGKEQNHGGTFEMDMGGKSGITIAPSLDGEILLIYLWKNGESYVLHKGEVTGYYTDADGQTIHTTGINLGGIGFAKSHPGNFKTVSEVITTRNMSEPMIRIQLGKNVPPDVLGFWNFIGRLEALLKLYK